MLEFLVKVVAPIVIGGMFAARSVQALRAGSITTGPFVGQRVFRSIEPVRFWRVFALNTLFALVILWPVLALAAFIVMSAAG